MRAIISWALWIVCILALQVGVARTAFAIPETLTFDEVATPVPGGVSAMGVTFSLVVGMAPSLDLTYGHAGLGDMTYLMGKVLEGDAEGVLIIDFAEPTTVVEFGLAFNTVTASGFHAADVELFDASLQSLGVTALLTSSLLLFTEGSFSHDGAAVSHVVIDFADDIPALPPRFALDNLTFEAPEPPQVPGLPDAFRLLLATLALGAVLWRAERA